MTDPATNTALVVYDDDGRALEPDKTNADAWQKVVASRLGPRMKRALLRVAAGESWRSAAEAEEYASHSDVYRNGTKYGVIDLATHALMQKQRSVARLSTEELERRLINDPASIKERDLIVASGVATDKILAHEKNEQGGGAGLASAMEQLADKLHRSGQALEIQVAVRDRDEPEPTTEAEPSDIIDIEPVTEQEPT